MRQLPFYKLQWELHHESAAEKVQCFLLGSARRIFHFLDAVHSDTLEAPADSLVLSELAKLGAHSC